MDKSQRRILSIVGLAYIHIYLTGTYTFLGINPKDFLGEDRFKKLQRMVDSTGDCEACGSPDIYCNGSLSASLYKQDPEPFYFSLLCNLCGAEYKLDFTPEFLLSLGVRQEGHLLVI